MGDKFAVGVDLGATKVLASVVNLSNGKIVSTSKKKTRAGTEGFDLVQRLSLVIGDALQESGMSTDKISGIGIGAAGMVDRERGVLLAAANIGTNDVPICEPLKNQFGLPVKLGNDVEVATIGEMTFGAGRNCSNFVCIFVGTGIGSGIVHGGKLHRGGSGTAGEIGHVVVVPDGLPCGCGGHGCLESYASRTAVAKSVVYDLSRGFDSVLRDKVDPAKGILRSKALAQALESKDSVATRAINRAAHYMGLGLTNVINFYNPTRIVMGGGLIEAVPLYLELAEEEARRRSLRIPARKTEIVKAELGDFAGTIGAALLLV